MTVQESQDMYPYVKGADIITGATSLGSVRKCSEGWR